MRTQLNYITFLFTLFCVNGFTQNNLSVLGETVLAINHNVTKNYSYNTTFRSRYFLNHTVNISYKQQQIDVFHFSNFKLNTKSKISFGVYYRNRNWFESGSDELRFTQQYNYKKPKSGIRFGHRFRTEQRILNNKTIFRQRYRLAIKFPLKDTKLKTGSTYLLNAFEGLLSLTKANKPETDIRISSQIGWVITKALKLQTGLEYRLEAFNLKSKNNVFVLTSAVWKI